MYMVGIFANLENRLHQFTENQSDLESYIDEANTYLSDAGIGLANRWKKEVIKRRLIYHLIEIGMIGTPNQETPLLDSNNLIITDSDGFDITTI